MEGREGHERERGGEEYIYTLYSLWYCTEMR